MKAPSALILPLTPYEARSFRNEMILGSISRMNRSLEIVQPADTEGK